MRAVAMGLGLCIWAVSAHAQSGDDLQVVERQLKADAAKAEELSRKAEILDGEIEALRSALIASAAAVQDAEQQVSEVEAALRETEAVEGARAQELARRSHDLGQVMMALEHIAARPMIALFFSDRPPIEQARAARLLVLASDELNRRASALKKELSELAKLRQEVSERRSRLATAVEKLAAENHNLTALLRKKANLQATTAKESEATKERMARLSEQARNLKDLLERLDSARVSAEATRTDDQEPGEATSADLPASPESDGAGSQPLTLRAFPDAGASIIRPVRGKIAAGFGATTETIGKSAGMVFTARSGAEVVAPYDGKVVFEGPFRSYGQILIIEHAGGYHSVLAGLEHAQVAVGQWLLAGEPVGVMAQGSAASLYFELRREGRPVDPAPWLGTDGSASAQNN